MKNIIHIIIVLFVFISSAQSQNINRSFANIPLKKHFDPNNYEGSIQSWSFDQDSLGVLYVANNDGLLEFDGLNWRKFKVPLSTRVRAVKVDSENRIFVGGQGQIGYFNRTQEGLVFTSLLNLLPPDKRNIAETWKILENKKRIFFNTESQLFVYENDLIKALVLPGYMRFAFIVNDNLFAQFYHEGLFKLVDFDFVHVKGTGPLSDIVSIVQNDNKSFCFTREGQVYEISNSGFTQVDIPFEMGTVNDAIKMSSGEYIIGTQNKGLVFLNSDFTFNRQLTKKRGLNDRTVKSVYEDQFQNLWVALNNGIDYLELSLPFSLLNEESGIEGTGYAAKMFQDKLYLGTNNGAFVQNYAHFELEEYPYEILNGSQGQVYNFSVIDNTLILNHDHGAYEIEKNRLIKIKDIGSWKFIKTPLPGLMLASGYRGLTFYKKNNNEWLKEKSIPNLDESMRMMEFQNDGNLWATHASKGAFRIQFDKNMNPKDNIKLFGKQDGLPSNIKVNVYSINNNLVFTSEKGIYDFNSDTEKFLPNKNLNKLLGPGYINEIVSNANNSIYFIQDQKLGELTQEGFGNFQKEMNIFKHVNKFLNDDLPHISILDNKNVIFGAKEGFVLYRPDEKPSPQASFNTIIKSVEIRTETDSIFNYDPSFKTLNKLKINNNESLKFEYAAPYFDGFKDLQYSYRLLPIDKGWSEWRSTGEKEFDFLPYGKYEFEVKALNIYGNESNVSKISFEVLTPWYLSKLAYGLYFFILLTAFLFFPLIQRKKFKAEKTIIHRNKEKELQLKNNEINQLVNDKLQTELDLKNDQLTTTAMQLIKNNDFIKEIKDKIGSSLNKKNTEKKLSSIMRMIDTELSNNDSWDKFEYHFDQVHSNYLKKLLEKHIKLSPREIKLAAFLRMNMSSKEISTMLNITPRSVELARYRLRKKLKLNRDQNLVEYLIELDNS